jgi:hypothetical protein
MKRALTRVSAAPQGLLRHTRIVLRIASVDVVLSRLTSSELFDQLSTMRLPEVQALIAFRSGQRLSISAASLSVLLSHPCCQQVATLCAHWKQLCFDPHTPRESAHLSCVRSLILSIPGNNERLRYNFPSLAKLYLHCTYNMSGGSGYALDTIEQLNCSSTLQQLTLRMRSGAAVRQVLCTISRSSLLPALHSLTLEGVGFERGDYQQGTFSDPWEDAQPLLNQLSTMTLCDCRAATRLVRTVTLCCTQLRALCFIVLLDHPANMGSIRHCSLLLSVALPSTRLLRDLMTKAVSSKLCVSLQWARCASPMLKSKRISSQLHDPDGQYFRMARDLQMGKRQLQIFALNKLVDLKHRYPGRFRIEETTDEHREQF